MYSKILQSLDRIIKPTKKETKRINKNKQQEFGADFSSFLDVPLAIH